MGLYSRIKDRLYLPLFVGACVFLSSLFAGQLHLSILALILTIASILPWLWYLLRLWRFRPSSDDDLRMVRNAQIALTCVFVMMMSLTLAMLLVFLSTFLNAFSDLFAIIFLPFGLLLCGIVLLSALVIVILGWRNDRLGKLRSM